jgi:predicted membrane-bound spermidine synthase
MIERRLLYGAVFAGGMSTLAIEITASRLLGYVFGTSNPVWASVIGLTLIYLTAGYFIGGRWADRSPTFPTLYQVIVWGAFTGGLMPLIARPILSVAGSAMLTFRVGTALGSFVVVLILFAIPITLLGCISPFAIRLAVQSVEKSGAISGRMYAISTLGSIIGTFIPTLYLIPEWGTIATFYTFSMILLAVGLLGLALHDRKKALRLAWTPILLTILTILLSNSTLRPPPRGTTLLYEKESAYNYIQVVEYTESDGSLTRLLLLNEGQGIHSQWNSKTIFYGRTWDYFLVAPFFNAAPFDPSKISKGRIAVVGLAAGTMVRQFNTVYGSPQIDGIEIDPAIVEAGKRYFEMSQPNLTPIVEDGRFALAQSPHRYALIGLDAYRVPYVPWHLTTVEFFQEVHAHLTDDGVAVINVGRTNNTVANRQDRRLVEAITATMSQVFPTVHTIDVPGSFNTILVGTRLPTRSENLSANLAALPSDADPALRFFLDTAQKNLKPTVGSQTIFTDDRAPVETIVDSMVLDFLTGGGTDQFTR